MDKVMAATKKPRNTQKTPETLSNVEALQNTIAELRQAGRLDNIDDARVRIALGLARAVDTMPDNPTLWREYRAAEKALREESEAHGDPFEDLIRQLSAEVRDEKKQETKNTRS
jgi:hypothetical protein